MRDVNHLLFGNHPKAGKLKQRTVSIIKIMKENGGRIQAADLESRLGISRIEAPSMFYKPLAAMRKWNLLRTHKSISFDESGKKTFNTEYELTPEEFLEFIRKDLVESVRKEMELV